MKYNTRTIKILEREKRKKIPLSIDETKYFSGRRKRGWRRDERKMHEERKPRRDRNDRGGKTRTADNERVQRV